MEVKPGYKQTEVGVIPGEWKVSTATEMCALVVDCKNRTPPVVSASEFAVVRTPNVRNGQFVLDDLRFTDESSYHEWTSRAVPQLGDVLITREAPLGEVCAVPKGFKLCLGQRMMLYRPSPSITDSRYLLYSLMSAPVKANLLMKVGGSTVGHAKVDDIRFLQLPCPPLPEQHAIATALSDVDALIQSLDRLIAKKRDLKQAAMQQLLTGQTRLPGFQGEWEDTTLGSVAEKIVGGGTPSRTTPEYWNGEIPWMTVKDFACHTPLGTLEHITHLGLTNSATRLIPKGTPILATRMALGKAVIFDVAVSINQDLKAIFPKKDINSRFLLFWFRLNEQSIAELGSGSTVMGISLSSLKRIAFLKPPLPEQTAIAEMLTEMDAELAALEQRRDKTRALKQGMMQELLTGRTRLV